MVELGATHLRRLKGDRIYDQLATKQQRAGICGGQETARNDEPCTLNPRPEAQGHLNPKP